VLRPRACEGALSPGTLSRIDALFKVHDQIEHIHHELDVQMKRMAQLQQLQQQLDEVRATVKQLVDASEVRPTRDLERWAGHKPGASAGASRFSLKGSRSMPIAEHATVPTLVAVPAFRRLDAAVGRVAIHEGPTTLRAQELRGPALRVFGDGRMAKFSSYTHWRQAR
jgi:hypothetical protein